MQRRKAARNPGGALCDPGLRYAPSGLRAEGSTTPQRAPEQAQPQQRGERQRQAENPALARARFSAQHVLDEALAAGHLGKTLLIGRDAPDLVIGKWRALVARRPLSGVEPVHFRLETFHVLDRAGVDFALTRGEVLRR